jgi:hypothetical protein
LIASLFAAAAPAGAQERAIEVSLTPKGDPQIAIWLEDPQGGFVDTLMVTRLVGTFGLGNRPGRRDFGGGYLWPYGKREMVLPVWAHRRGVEYDRLVFQDCRESSLGWHESHSSREPFYCRPVTPSEMQVDTITCPTVAFNTDKGIPVRMIDSGKGVDCSSVAQLPQKSVYPPRNDVERDGSRDWTGVADYDEINTLDAISKATPPTDQLYRVAYQLPAGLAPGTYTIWVEVNQEWDSNPFHDYNFFVDPQLQDYGMDSIGQPSVLWKVPIEIGSEPTHASARDYTGYGAPAGETGELHAPDNTITTGVPGSGAERLLLMGDARVRVGFNPDAPCALPDAVQAMRIENAQFDRVTISFLGSISATMYEVRYTPGAGRIATEEEFFRAVPGPSVMSGDPRAAMTFTIEQLQPDQSYSIAIRGYDACGQSSPITAIDVRTPIRKFVTVDACFIATAAYGGKEESHVVELRRFRDRVLMKSELGRDAVDVYYSISPPIADVIREHESLKFIVRTMLGPVVSKVRDIE